MRLVLSSCAPCPGSAGESELAALSWEVHQSPLDRVARLVLADWLDDHGEDAEAAIHRAVADVIGEYLPGRIARHPMIGAYLECALWASNDESDEQGGEPLDAYSIADFAERAIASAIEDCVRFDHAHVTGVGMRPCKRVGIDLWLSRNGHGAGFYCQDDYYGEEAAAELQEAAGRMGEVDAYPGDDGKIYFSR
jgi:uncharacterized protein (TIGR02996 family)